MCSLRVRCTKNPLLTVLRSSRWKRRMVYILVANKPHKYNSGRRSRIIYIGTTGGGARRPATSAVDKASSAFSDLRGVKKIDVHIATCRGRKRMKTWEHLESARLDERMRAVKANGMIGRGGGDRKQRRREFQGPTRNVKER